MSTKFEDVKQFIVEAQLASTPKDKVVNDIMKGTADLLSANDIIKRLGITADEFKELVNLPNHYLRTRGGLAGALHNNTTLFNANIELINQDLEKASSFPKPDLYILGKARWKKETFKKWLEEQCV
jgi:hypothetical protein